MKYKVQILRLATKEATHLRVYGNKQGMLFMPKKLKAGHMLDGVVCIHLYAVIPQNDVPIEVGDWFVELEDDSEDFLLNQMTESSLRGWNHDVETRANFLKKCKKVIATTNESLSLFGIELSFLEKYGDSDAALVDYARDYTNRTCDSCNLFDKECELKLENECCTATQDDDAHGDYWISRTEDHEDAEVYKPKLNSDNTIILFPMEEEEKIYSKNEVREMLFDIATELCWDDKDEDELIANCQAKLLKIKENL